MPRQAHTVQKASTMLNRNERGRGAHFYNQGCEGLELRTIQEKSADRHDQRILHVDAGFDQRLVS
jgi:hypothetical protein